MMPNHSNKESRPFISLLQLLLLALGGVTSFTIMAFLIGFFIYGKDILQAINQEIGFLKLIQIASTLGTFMVPALIYAKIKSNSVLTFLKLNTRVKSVLFILAVALVITFSPFLEWTIKINKQMELPNFLRGVEHWMKMQEYALEKLTIQLLRMNSSVDLIVNLIMIAILPAIGEELLFRGCLQRIMTQWTGNYHFGIWVAAIIFSAIHLQFYGFLPRMLLGALFGYLLVWSKSMWLPILAHFINNTTAVISAYVYQKNGQSIEKIYETPYDTSTVLYIVSFLLTGVLLWAFYQQALQYPWRLNNKDGEKLD